MAIDLNAIKAEYTRIESKGQSNFLDNFVPMPEGEGSVVIRLLPPRNGGTLPYVATRTHKINGRNYHCPMSLVNGKWVGKCPICNEYRKLWKQSEGVSEAEANALKDQARLIKPNERYYWNAIVRKVNIKGHEQLNVGPRVFSTGKELQGKLLRYMAGDDAVEMPGLGDVTDVTATEGRDLKVIKRINKAGGWPSYTDSVFLNNSNAGSDADVEHWLENLQDLNSYRRILPEEELARQVRIYRGEESDTDTDYTPSNNSQDDDCPAPSPVRPVAQRTEVSRPPVSATVQKPNIVNVRPKPVVEDTNDEAMADEDFLNKLKNM